MCPSQRARLALTADYDTGGSADAEADAEEDEDVVEDDGGVESGPGEL